MLGLKKLNQYLFDSQKESTMRLVLAGILSVIFSTFVIFTKESGSESQLNMQDQNLSVLIPKNHILYPFEANNFNSIEPLLESYNMVRVYDPKTGKIIAKNIKVLRSPQNPEHLAFLLPVNIANDFAEFGLNFKVVIQDITKDEPQFLWVKQLVHKKNKPRVTFGG